MIWVRHKKSFLIIKNSFGLLKGYFMFLKIDGSFGFIPCELHKSFLLKKCHCKYSIFI